MREFTEADRPAILDLLKIHGPTNAPRLAKLRGVNLTAVRQQLAALQREKLIQVRVEKRQVGRPTHLYALSEKAESLFPQSYGPFALTLLRQLRDIDGEQKIDQMLDRRTRALIATYRKRLAGMSTAEKWRELARIRADEGYMARAEGLGMSEHHCPIAAIAREFPQVCRFEKKLFEAVLGAPLDRTEHLASGGRACVYAPVPKNA
ncbi:MAG TPA: crosslink repair DNA glycosylase YcaQ family protein [Planctomycetota bacterium]|nr:crosslink repair DNA glycosylase YcaQ family protein [Planctomycetota bacterium]